MSDTNSEYSLDDEVIAEIGKLVQVAILTGTDVVDNLRTLRLEESSSTKLSLLLSSEYRENSEKNINTLLENIDTLAQKNDNKNGQT